MFRLLFIVFIGITIGYFMGFNDAQKHDKNVVYRVVSGVGGNSRDRLSNDIDARLERQAGR